jgi:hypothetical protein
MLELLELPEVLEFLEFAELLEFPIASSGSARSIPVPAAGEK